MKKTVTALLILMLLNSYTPGAWAEISQELDPMVPVDLQSAGEEETSGNSAATVQASHGVGVAAATTGEIKTEKPKKEKVKKNSSKKSSSQKSSKTSSKDPKASKKNSR